jgi:hypothetical protein
VRKLVAYGCETVLVLAMLAALAGCGGSGVAGRPTPAALGGFNSARLSEASAHAGAAAVHASYVGPRILHGHVTLRARARSDTRIVAVTFMLAGRALGTVTRAPWALDVDAALLPAGTAQLRVGVVDRLGTRTTSRATSVRVLPGGERVQRISSQGGLDAALPALARGAVTVRLAPGTYRANALVLGPGARLSGSGATTVLVPPRTASGAAVLRTRANHVRISNLAVDGGGRVSEAVVIADGARDVRVQRIEVSGVRYNGVLAWGAHSDVSVQDSTLLGGGAAAGAGVFDQGSRQSSQVSVIRTRVSGFRGYGVLFAQRFYGLRTAAMRNLALDNNISDIHDPYRHDGTDAGGIWTGGVEAAVIGNTVSDTGTDGIETVGSSTGDAIIANTVSGTPVGIYIEHSTNQSLVAANRISKVRNGINVEWRHAGGGSNANTFAGNRIAADEVGMFVDVDDDNNAISQNAFTAAAATPIVLQGSSGNQVRENLACDAGTRPFVVQQSGLTQTGAIARSSHNTLAKNERTGPCTAS